MPIRTVLARPYGSRNGREPAGSLNSMGGGIGGGGGGGMCELLSADIFRVRSKSPLNGEADGLVLKLCLRGVALDDVAGESDSCWLKSVCRAWFWANNCC